MSCRHTRTISNLEDFQWYYSILLPWWEIPKQSIAGTLIHPGLGLTLHNIIPVLNEPSPFVDIARKTLLKLRNSILGIVMTRPKKQKNKVMPQSNPARGQARLTRFQNNNDDEDDMEVSSINSSSVRTSAGTVFKPKLYKEMVSLLNFTKSA